MSLRYTVVPILAAALLLAQCSENGTSPVEPALRSTGEKTQTEQEALQGAYVDLAECWALTSAVAATGGGVAANWAALTEMVENLIAALAALAGPGATEITWGALTLGLSQTEAQALAVLITSTASYLGFSLGLPTSSKLISTTVINISQMQDLLNALLGILSSCGRLTGYLWSGVTATGTRISQANANVTGNITNQTTAYSTGVNCVSQSQGVFNYWNSVFGWSNGLSECLACCAAALGNGTIPPGSLATCNAPCNAYWK